MNGIEVRTKPPGHRNSRVARVLAAIDVHSTFHVVIKKASHINKNAHQSKKPMGVVHAFRIKIYANYAEKTFLPNAAIPAKPAHKSRKLLGSGTAFTRM